MDVLAPVVVVAMALVVVVASIIVIILARGIAKGVVRELVQHIATVVVIILAQGVVIMGVKMFLGNLLSRYHSLYKSLINL